MIETNKSFTAATVVPQRRARRSTRINWINIAQQVGGVFDLPLWLAIKAWRALPEQPAVDFSRRLSLVGRRITRRRILGNMKLVLGHPEWSDQDWQELWARNARDVGQLMSENLNWPDLPLPQLLSLVQVRGEEHLRTAIAEGRGVLILANHLGNIVSPAVALRRIGLSCCGAGIRMWSPGLERMLQRLIQKCGSSRVYVGEGVPAAAARTFRNGGIFHIFVDFVMPDPRNVWMPFGPAEISVSLGPALLALRHRVPIVCVSTERLNATQHLVTFHPPWSPVSSGHAKADAFALTQRMMDWVSTELAQRPWDWRMWCLARLRPSRVNAPVFDRKAL